MCFPENQVPSHSSRIFQFFFSAAFCCSPCWCCPVARADLPLPCAWHGLFRALKRSDVKAGRGATTARRERDSCVGSGKHKERRTPAHQTQEQHCAQQALTKSNCLENPHAAGAWFALHVVVFRFSASNRSSLSHVHLLLCPRLIVKLVHLVATEIFSGNNRRRSLFLCAGTIKANALPASQEFGGAVVRVDQASSHRDSGSCSAASQGPSSPRLSHQRKCGV